jgi:hypothetical protein
MLYAGCSSCRTIVPLWCAGQFMPHMPVLVAGTAMGPYCNFCGPLPPIFTCTVCWTRQALYLPGMAFTPPRWVPGLTQYVAPVVQAPQGLGQNQLTDLFRNSAMQFLKEFAGGFGGQLGQDAGSAVAAWVSGWS